MKIYKFLKTFIEDLTNDKINKNLKIYKSYNPLTKQFDDLQFI